MVPNHAERTIAFRRAYGKAAPPEKITQEAFEGNDRHLRRLLRIKPAERPDPQELWEYLQDLRYTRIQSALLAYLLPSCLELWCEDLRGTSDQYGGFVEHLYPVLADRTTFSEHLTSKQTAAVSDYMRQVILDEIDDQSGLAYQGSKARPYRWIRALASYGVLFTNVDRVWSVWWSLETVGRAIAATQYVSCLMYPENENPVFAPWTPNSGGGPPCLWEFEGHLYEHHWLEPNVAFLREALNVSRVTEDLNRAVDRLIERSEHEVAARIREDLPLLADTLQSRCAELPRLLEATQESGRPRAWS